MTEQTYPHIPAYAHSLRISAANEAQQATTYTIHEQHLSAKLSRCEEWANTERARIEGELAEARAKAEQQLNDIDNSVKALQRDLAEAGRRKTLHQADATGAEGLWLDWCTKSGIDPRTLPPVPVDTSGPLPTLPAALPAAEPMAPAEPTDPTRTIIDADIPVAGGDGPDEGPFHPDPNAGGA